MSLDGISGVQARIAEIQQNFSSGSTSGSQPSSSSASSMLQFANLLDAASAVNGDGTNSDGSSSGTGTSLSSVLANALGLNGSDGSTALGGTGSSLLSTLQQLESTSGATTLPTAPVGSGSAANQKFIQSALAMNGDAYVYGASASPLDPHPKAFDCSELTKWAAARAGVTIPDVAENQYMWLKKQGMLIPVQQAINTPGALLFSFSSEPTPGAPRPSHAHVAISLGNGKTIEARGRAYGVGIFDAANRFNYAAVVPGLTA